MSPRTAPPIAMLAVLSGPGAALAQPIEPALERCAVERSLSDLAQEAVRASLAGAELSAEELRARANARGLHPATLRVWVGDGGNRRPAALDAWLRAQRLDPRVARCGVGRESGRLALLVDPRRAWFEVREERSALWTEARFVVPVRSARVVLLGPRSQSVEAPVGTWIRVPSPGVWSAQLVADAGMGPIPWALRSIRVGATARDGSWEPSGEGVTDARTWLVALNVLRAQDRAPALRADPLLASLAEERVAARAERATVAHALEDGDSPDEFLRRRGIRADRVAENLARARTLREAFERLSVSPSHRRIRAMPELDAVGVAVLQAPDGWYVVELYAARPAIGS
jgi:hypothetical protein